jgi:2-polyprenyl-6-methoxyphenol hydroxylase-like FAD-dependent oxidoreductase
LWPNGLAALASFGADHPVRDRALAAPGMAMRSHTGRLLYELSGPDLDAVGGRGVAIERADLLDALAGMLGPDSVRLGVRCAGVRSAAGHASVALDHGDEVAADLVIAADGIRSRVRAAAGIRARLRFNGFTVWRATVPFPLPAAPGLLSLGGSHQFGIWKLPGGRVYWFASAPSQAGNHRPGRSRPPEVFARWHEPVADLLAATPTEQIVTTDIYDSAPLRAWSAGRVVLVGDAAHPSLPNMGQGTSQAFEDAAVLADELATAPDIGSALRNYHHRRRARARSAWSQARLLARLGNWRNPAACRLRERMIIMMPAYAQRRQLARMFAFRT